MCKSSPQIVNSIMWLLSSLQLRRKATYPLSSRAAMTIRRKFVRMFRDTSISDFVDSSRSQE